MSHHQFLPIGVTGRLGHVVEECGEVLAAIGKSQRFGLDSVNPLLPAEERETNRDWLKRELVDLKQAIARLEGAL